MPIKRTLIIFLFILALTNVNAQKTIPFHNPVKFFNGIYFGDNTFLNTATSLTPYDTTYLYRVINAQADTIKFLQDSINQLQNRHDSLVTAVNDTTDLTTVFYTKPQIDSINNDTINLSSVFYNKGQVDSICNAKLDSALATVVTDTTYNYKVIDSLKTRVTTLENSVNNLILTNNSVLIDTLITISSVQLLAGDSVLLLQAPGDTLVYSIENITGIYNYGTTTYSSGGASNIYWYDGGIQNTTYYLTLPSTAITRSYSGSRKFTSLNYGDNFIDVNSPVWIDLANFNDGNGTLQLLMSYRTFTVTSTDQLAAICDSAKTINDTTFYLFFSENLDSDSIPNIDSFYVTENGTRFGVQTVTITNDTVRMEMDSTILAGSTLLVDYLGNKLTDLAGNKTANWTDTTIINNVESPIAAGDTIQCTATGVIYAASTTATGYWEYSIYKAAASSLNVAFISADATSTTANGGYSLRSGSTEYIWFYANGVGQLFTTADAYYNAATWYTIRVERNSVTNEFFTGAQYAFRVLIKGGTFGSEFVELVEATGANPVSQSSYTTSTYFTLGLGTGDLVGNINVNGTLKNWSDFTTSSGTFVQY